MKPLLKWAGGKHKLATEISKLFDGPPRGVYFEPFLGAGAVFLHRRATGEVKNAVLSDINEKLIGFHVAVRDDVEAVIREIRKLPADETWAEWFEDVRDRFNRGPFEGPAHAARFVWLNKCCFNGLYRENSSGHFNVPKGSARVPSIPSVKHFREVSELLAGATIECAGYSDALTPADPGDQVYADPPYIPISATSNFTAFSAGGFDAGAQEELARMLLAVALDGVKIIASNSDTKFTRELYPSKRWNLHAFDVARSIASKSRDRVAAAELLIVSK